MTEIAFGLVGVLVGSLVSWGIFRKQNKIDRYLQFVEDIEEVWKLSKEYESALLNNPAPGGDPKLAALINHHLNRAYFKALIATPDHLFRKIDKLLNGAFSKEKRNRLYFLMRKDLFRFSRIAFEDIVNRDYALIAQSQSQKTIPVSGPE